MKILVINCGSSSLKYQLFDMTTNDMLAKGICEQIGGESTFTHKVSADESKNCKAVPMTMNDHAEAIKIVIDTLTSADMGVLTSMSEIAAVGHRVLHGAEKFSGSVLVTEAVKDAIRECFDLGPLHNPANLMGIESCEKVMPGVPQVAVFDTGFHATMPDYAYMYALPYEYYEKYGIRRYGFHGTSHRFVSKRCIELLGGNAEGTKIVTCHLGNGSSISAVKDGKCLDTTMDAVMNKKSGMLGVTQKTSDNRTIENDAKNGCERAKLVESMLCHQLTKYIGGFAAAMGGVDAVVFTGGIGENNPHYRSRVAEKLEFLGTAINEETNAKRGEELEISVPGSKVKLFVIPTNEELMIAQDTYEIVTAL